MTQINLLPWREQARQEMKLQFMMVLGFFIGLTLILIILIHLYLGSLIREENKRIHFLQTTLGEKQTNYNNLQDKKKQQVAIETELKFITTLREKSFRAVSMLNELVKIVPTTITLDKLIREDNKVTLIGKAQSELQITLLMKNMTKSRVFKQPVLTRISDLPENADSERVFELVALLTDGMPS